MKNKSLINCETAQTGTEVMLLIGLAVAMALVVGYYLKRMAGQIYTKGANIANISQNTSNTANSTRP